MRVHKEFGPAVMKYLCTTAVTKWFPMGTIDL